MSDFWRFSSFLASNDQFVYGTVAFTVGGEVATQACYDDVVTVTVTPDEGYSQKDVTVRAYTSWESAARSFRAPSLVDDITVTKQTDGTWTFTMPEANVWVVVNVHLRNHLMDGSDPQNVEYVGTGEAGGFDVKADAWGSGFVKKW